MIIHISNERFERIRSQQFRLSVNFTATTVVARPGDTEIHLLEGERALCPTCGIECASIAANTPAEYASEKAKLTARYEQYRDEDGVLHTLWEDEVSAHAVIEFEV